MERIWFDKQGIVWKRVMRLAAIWAAVVAVVVFLDHDPPASPRAQAGAVASAVSQPAPVVLAMSPTPVSLPRAPQLVASEAASADKKLSPSCQSMSPDRDATGKTLEDRMAEMDVSGQRRAVIERMSRSSVEWHRAAALLLEPVADTVAELTCEKAPCDGRARGDEALNRVDVLARQAASTADPKVYALAFNACNKGALRQRGTCQLVSADQWARLDPGNAAPWLFKLDEASRSGDIAGQLLAFQRIAEAQRNDGGYGAMGGAVVANAVEGDAAQLAAFQLVVEASGVQAAFVGPSPQAMQSLCTPALMADVGRRHLCNTAAEVLINKADSLLDRLWGVSLANKLGWPPEQLQAIKAETDALHGAFASRRLPASAKSACAVLKDALAVAKRVGEAGEIGAARQWARESGKSLAQLAKEHNAHILDMSQKARRDPSLPERR